MLKVNENRGNTHCRDQDETSVTGSEFLTLLCENQSDAFDTYVSPPSLTEMPATLPVRRNVKMMVLWVGLLVLHPGYSQVPVITVELGEPATVTCVLPNDSIDNDDLMWYKQRTGDKLQTIATVWSSRHTQYAAEFSESKLTVRKTKNFSNLTILKTTEEDEAIYHCAVSEGINSAWSGTYVLVKGNTERTSNYSVVQTSTVSDPVRPGDSVTLQCSVLSDSGNKTCPGGLSVYWFRAASDASAPGIISTDGNSKCEQRSESVKSCRHRFSTVSSSDAGTYHCAVATCGRILFGEGTKLQIEQTIEVKFIALVTSIILLAISVIGHSVFMCSHASSPVNEQSNAPVALQQHRGGWNSQQREEDKWVYSAVVFTVMTTEDGAVTQVRAAERERLLL